MRVYAFVAAVVGCASIVLQYAVGGHFQSLAQTVTFFGYFSILSNILATLTLTRAALLPAGRGQWLMRPAVAGAIMLYMFVIGLIFTLQPLPNFQGWRLAAEIGLHHVMPIAFLVFWLFAVPKGTLVLRHVFVWLVFPVVYLAFLLVCGPCYAFLDADRVGIDSVLGNIGLATVIFVALGQSLLLIDRVLGRAARTHAKGQSLTARQQRVFLRSSATTPGR